jgi:hypothetical protein
MATRTTEVPAIFVNEAERLLDRLGMGDAYRSGDLICSNCREAINGRGLGAVKMHEGKVLVVCSRWDCVDRLNG